jgi:hypothetical protein
MGVVWRAAGLVLLGYLVVCAVMFLSQRKLQYAPGRLAPAPAEAGFAGVTEVALTASDGTPLVLWHAAAEPGAMTVLYFQGNAGEIADRPRRWAAYRAAGLGVAYLSYRGFGGSGGEISEAGLHMDADAAYDWLLAQGVAPDRLALVGESLGSGVAVRLAAERPVAALMLEAPYTSAAEVAALRYGWLPVRLLMLDQFRSIDLIGRLKAPILIQHGEADATIPFALGQALFAAAPEPKVFRAIPGAGHEISSDPAVWAAQIDFLRTLPSGP